MFADGIASRDALFTVLARSNPIGPRLGLAVSRKVSKRAVDRNLIKRIARECFRRRRAGLSAADYVVIARSRAVAESNHALSTALGQHLDRLSEQLAGER